MSQAGLLTHIAHRMSDPGTTYRTRDEIQRMRSTQDAINGIKIYLNNWGILNDKETKVSVGGCRNEG